MKQLLPIAVAAVALTVPGVAHASLIGLGESGAASAKVSNAIAKVNQDEGSVAPNACTATRSFTVSGPAHIQVLVAGTNVGGQLLARVIGRTGDVGAGNGFYDANSAGTYGFQVCFVSNDGIDSTIPISYVDVIITSPR